MASASGPFYYSCEGPLALVASSLLQRCTSPLALRKARQLHALILIAIPQTSTPFLRNNLISLYSKCGSLGDAQKVFDTMPTRNLVSYNAMISAFSRAPHHARSALHLFQKMDFEGFKPNASTLSSIVQASSSLQDPWTGAALHSRVVSCGFSNNVCVQTALLGMYSNLGSVEAADQVFTEMSETDVIAWNSIILSNVKNGSIDRGLQLFSCMLQTGLVPNNSTFSIVLNACGRAGDQIRGRIIHAQMIKTEFLLDVSSRNALLDMYTSCGDIMTAVLVFQRIEIPDLVSWNSLIAGYSDVGDGEKAMEMFVQLPKMSPYGEANPDEYTFAATVSATASLPSIYYGKPLHSQIIKVGLEFCKFVGNTLINMYFLNDEPDSSRKLFNCIPEKDVIIWTEMIVGHSRLGEAP